MHDRAKRTQNLLVANFLDSHFGHTAQYTYCPDSYYAETPQQHNLRPTVAARQPRIGHTRHALTRALDARHATARVTTSASHGESHTIVRITACTHSESQRSPPCAIVAASTSHERVEEPLARNERNLGALLRENLRF